PGGGTRAPRTRRLRGRLRRRRLGVRALVRGAHARAALRNRLRGVPEHGSGLVAPASARALRSAVRSGNECPSSAPRHGGDGLLDPAPAVAMSESQASSDVRIVPELSVRNGVEAVGFYARAFG